MAYELTEQKKIGLGLLGFGILFTFLGVVLFFDRGLLALGNIFWLTGVALLLGWQSLWNLFISKANIKGSASFVLGLFFLFVRWPIVGIILELYGCLVLFGGFWPTVQVFLYEVPILGWIIRFLFCLYYRHERFMPEGLAWAWPLQRFLISFGTDFPLSCSGIHRYLMSTHEFSCLILMISCGFLWVEEFHHQMTEKEKETAR